MTNGHINPANVPDIALKDGHSIPQVGPWHATYR